MRAYFCGWYFRCQSENRTLALIPSIHKTEDGDFCSLQIITGTGACSLHLPGSIFHQDGNQILIGENRFGPQGISLNMQAQGLTVTGSVAFGPLTPLRFDIMGPFRYVPFLECRHSVFSMRHTVDGTITVNGVPFHFQKGTGYIEGDRGRSFPKKYVWTQCSLPEGALMLSVAEIPLFGFRFTGIIGAVLLRGKEYRLATYLGARAVKIQDGEIVIRQGRLCLTVRRQGEPGHPLQAPILGDMSRMIHEHPACKVYYCFQDHEETLLELEAANAALEYEY